MKIYFNGKLNRSVEGSPNGYYPIVVVPEYLIGRRVVILPLSDDGIPLEADMNEKKKIR